MSEKTEPKKVEVKDEDNKVKLNLTPYERVVLTSFLPKRSSLTEGIMISQLQETLSLSDEEMEDYDVTILGNGSIAFGDGAAKNGSADHSERALNEVKPFYFGRHKFRILKDSITRVEKQGELPVDKKVHNLYYKITDKGEDNGQG